MVAGLKLVASLVVVLSLLALAGCSPGEPHFRRGLLHANEGQYAWAIQEFDEAIRLQPEVALAFAFRGSAYLEKGEYDRAIQDFDQAIRLDPKDALVFRWRGTAYLEKGEYGRAIEDFDQAIRLKPKETRGFLERGRAYFLKGEYDRAIQDFDQAGLAGAYGRAQVQFTRGQFAEAASGFLKFTQAAPENPYGALWLYLAETRAGQSGLDTLRAKAGRLDLTCWPGPVVRVYLGEGDPEALLSASQGRTQRCQAPLSYGRMIVVSVGAANPRTQRCQAHFYLGQHLLIQGQRDAAVRMFQAAVATCPRRQPEFKAADVELKRLGHEANVERLEGAP